MRILISVFNITFFRLRVILRAILSPVNLGVAALAETDGKLILVRQTYTTGWYLPGGGVERGEPPVDAILRELREEIGLVSSLPPEFFGLYVRRILWVTNLNVVYRVRNIVFDFKPNIEIREVRLIDPAERDVRINRGVQRRLMELSGKEPVSPYW